MAKTGIRVATMLSATALIAVAGCSKQSQTSATGQRQPAACTGDNGGLSLSPGFCATIFADNIGHARHMVVGPDGTLYANTWSGMYFRNAPPPPGGFLVAMKDSNGDGKADSVQRFGASSENGGAGGTGIALYNGAIYAEEKDKILRFPLKQGETIPTTQPEVVLSGMPLDGIHPMHPFTIGADGSLFVSMGSTTNVCEDVPPGPPGSSTPGARGQQPCAAKATHAGIWRYDANKTGQVFSPAERYASGIRNTGGLAYDADGRLFVTQHGRDLLAQNWPKFYTTAQGAELPAEELIELKQGADYGWPECYYDQFRKSLVLAPEYGGDGKTAGLCAQRQGPAAAFPGHWAPNDVVFAKGGQFPKGYQGGALIAFHGSWNRAPAPQAGYLVAFQPMQGGRASGDYVVFADGFAGGEKGPGTAEHRPAGLAIGPDGALYVSDDVKGRIWRITYTGNGTDAVAPAAAAPAPASPKALGGQGQQPALPVPPGATAEQVALGRRIFHGQASGGTCSGCHGTDGAGGTVGPALNNGTWVWSDGTLDGIRRTIVAGVPKPKNFAAPMPPKGGAALSDADTQAVSAYVWAIGHAKASAGK